MHYPYRNSVTSSIVINVTRDVRHREVRPWTRIQCVFWLCAYCLQYYSIYNYI